MTPREPDRFDKQAEEIIAAWNAVQRESRLVTAIAAALHAVEVETLERAAQLPEMKCWHESRRRPYAACEWCQLAKDIRALASPAAAPAAEICNATMGEDRLFYTCTLPRGHVGSHKDRNVAEWTDAPLCSVPPSEPAAPAHLQTTEPECTCPPSDRDLQARGLLLRHVKACPLRTMADAPVPSEHVAPAPDLLELLREAFSIVSLQAARNPVRFNINLRDRMAAALAARAATQSGGK